MESSRGLWWVVWQHTSMLPKHSWFFLPLEPKAGDLDPRLVRNQSSGRHRERWAKHRGPGFQFKG